MNQKTKLAKAIALVIASSSLSVGYVSVASASTNVMYNTYNNYGANNIGTDNGSTTDGWVWGHSTSSTGDSNASAAQWAGTVGTGLSNTTPFGYVGSPHLNWGATLSAGGSLQVSSQDAFDRYGFYADIDTAAGAWVDTEAAPQGWRHNTDIGLFKSDVTQNVTLNLSTLSNLFGNFGVTVFEGQATNTGFYTHHSTWNNAAEGAPPVFPVVPFGVANPFQTTGLDVVVGYQSVVDSNAGFTFEAAAGQVYSIYLGGSGGLNWTGVHDGYTLDISTVSSVPVPAAAWLMGSSLLGLAGMRRKKQSK